MANYYIIVNNKQQGPYSIAQLRQLNIAPQTPVWAQGMPDWQAADQVPELASLFSATAPKQNQTLRKLFVTVALMAVLIIGAAGVYVYVNRHSLIDINPTPPTASVATTTNFNTDSADAAMRAAAEERKRAEQERKMLAARQSIETQYDIKIKSYNTALLGGVSDVFIEVFNTSAYTINSLTFEVLYYKSNGDVWLNEELTATNIAPNSSLIVEGPNTDRGTKVETGRIIAVRVNEIAYCYEAGNWANGLDDPYKCQE